MVDNEEFVPVEKADKIPKLNIPNDLLRYCFYILHKKKYGIRPQKKYFIDFMHKNLVQFESVGYTTLKTAFSSKPHSRDDNYIPDIIKRECKTSRNC